MSYKKGKKIEKKGVEPEKEPLPLGVEPEKPPLEPPKESPKEER